MSEVIRDYNEFARWLSARGLKSLFVVCGNSFAGIAPGRFLDCLAAVGFMMATGYWNDWQNALLYISDANKKDNE